MRPRATLFMKTINLMTHVVAGYPRMKECEEIVLAMVESGVSYVEIQFPFSDPIADGPTIMHANEKALAQGITTDDCFALIKRLKRKINTPILIMTYFNIAFRYGLERFCKKAKECNVYGLIIPDIQIDEEKYDHYLEICKKYNLHAIQIVSPITTNARLRKISKAVSGFVYCVSTFGLTGTRKQLNPELNSYLKNVKKYIKLPLALGFGISNKDQVIAASKCADIVVIGSKIVNVCDSCKGDKSIAVKGFLQEILAV